jgi:hypothetical protein
MSKWKKLVICVQFFFNFRVLCVLEFYFHVTALHRNKFIYNKKKQMH